VTRVGVPSAAHSSAFASSAAIGMPMIPGPTTAISRTKVGLIETGERIERAEVMGLACVMTLA
jgi:hypothetical protein